MTEKTLNNQYILIDTVAKRKGYSIIPFMEVLRKFSKIPIINIGEKYYMPVIYVDDAVKIYECVYFGKCN